MKKPLLYYFVLIIAAATLIPNSLARAEDKPVFKLGAILILTGSSSNYGFHSRRGATLAEEEINAAGGINGRHLQIIYEDETGSKAQAAVTAYRKLTSQDHVKFILGPNWQDALTALAPLSQHDKVFLITPSTPTSEKTPPNIFSTWPDPEQEVDIMAKRIFEHSKRLAVLSVEQVWEGIVDAQLLKSFKALGGEIVAHEIPSPDTTDVRTEVLRVKAANPDAIFISSYALFGMYAKELKKQNIALPLYGIEVDQAAIDSADSAANGMEYIGPSLPDSSFVQEYRTKFGGEPDVPASNAYDAVKMLAKAVGEVGDNPDAVSGYFRKLKEYHGASGVITSENGRTKMSLSIYIVKNGKYEKL